MKGLVIVIGLLGFAWAVIATAGLASVKVRVDRLESETCLCEQPEQKHGRPKPRDPSKPRVR